MSGRGKEGVELFMPKGQQPQKQAQEGNWKPTSPSGRDAGALVGQDPGQCGFFILLFYTSPDKDVLLHSDSKKIFSNIVMHEHKKGTN